MAIFSRGVMGGGALDGGADGARAEGAPVEGGFADAPPDTAPTAVWQDGDSWLKLLCRHCNAALPPVGTPEQ